MALVGFLFAKLSCRSATSFRFHGRSKTRHSQQQVSDIRGLRSPGRFPNRVGSLKWFPFDSSSTEWAWTATALAVGLGCGWPATGQPSDDCPAVRMAAEPRGEDVPDQSIDCFGRSMRPAFLERARLHSSWPICLRAGPSPDRARRLSGSGPLPRTSGTQPALGSSLRDVPGRPEHRCGGVWTPRWLPWPFGCFGH